MENANHKDLRNEARNDPRFTKLSDLQANVIGETAYVYGGVAGQEKPYALSGVLNESTQGGCSIIMPWEESPSLAIGAEYLIKVHEKGSWAVLCWRKEFGESTAKLGFRYL